MIFTHPKILDVAVVGVPDEVWGERVVAVIRWKDESDQPTAAELVEFCTERLARHKAPKEWFQRGGVPTDRVGQDPEISNCEPGRRRRVRRRQLIGAHSTSERFCLGYPRKSLRRALFILVP